MTKATLPAVWMLAIAGRNVQCAAMGDPVAALSSWDNRAAAASSAGRSEAPTTACKGIRIAAVMMRRPSPFRRNGNAPHGHFQCRERRCSAAPRPRAREARGDGGGENGTGSAKLDHSTDSSGTAGIGCAR